MPLRAKSTKSSRSPGPSLTIERVPCTALTEDPANARQHNDRNLQAIQASLQRFGQQKPLVVNAHNQVVAGNGTLRAARALGWTHVDIVRTHLAGLEAVGYAIADNRTAELAEWDPAVLAQTLATLQADTSIDALVTGFDAGEIEQLLADASAGPVVEDEVPAPPADPVTKPGDLYTLGRHRLLCGDSTKAEDVERVMAGARACCVFTDPPYGVSVAAKNRFLNTVQPSGRCLVDIVDDTLSPEDLKVRLLPAFVNLRERIMADDCTLFVSAPQGGDLGMMMMMMMKEAGLPVRHVLIWEKNAPTFSMGRLDYDYRHEPILLTWCKRHKRPMKGEHKTSVWNIDKPRKCDQHPTMKPVELYANAYLNNSDRGDVVADIYSGSGTAFIAAEQLGRTCYGIEISPQYCDVIVNRWEALTGRKAERN